MIRLTYAHRWGALADALANHLRGVARDPLEPVTILIPHALATSYLKIALADRLGIAGNLRFVHWRPLVTEVYEQDETHRLLTPSRLHQLLLVTLDALDGDLGPVTAYLHADAAYELRRTQLAHALASTFDEYGLCRPDLLARWTSGGDDPSGWQAEVWRRMRATAAEVPGPRLVTLDELLPADGAAGHAPPLLPDSLFVFDVPFGAPVLPAVLAAWSDRISIHVYATNPCMEFWEDLPAGGRAARGVRARLLPADGGWSDLHDEQDPLPLVLWGRPARENVRLTNQLTDCDFDGAFGDARPPESILERVQQDILHRAPPADTPSPADASLRLHACPSPRREAEIIVERIWASVAATAGTADPLLLSDVGIIIAGSDADAYRSHFAAVFEEYHQLPHHFVDVPVARGSRIIEVVELLLELPTSRFTRQDILRVLTHPTVAPTDEAIDSWAAWCDDLGIVHGADHDDHAGTYVQADLLNWDQGLTRLTLGLVMPAPADDEVYESAAGRYVPYPVGFDRTDGAAALATLARSLIADARFLAAARLSFADWAELFRMMVSGYVRAQDDDDERDLLRVLRIFEQLADDDLTGALIPFIAAREAVITALASLTENVGQPLADGVVVAPLARAAHLPLRRVYLPGLHEGAFPARDVASSIDVRGAERRLGEVSPRERDQALFLARLMATTDAVELSYVDRDGATGEPRAPAPTVVELLRILDTYLEGGESSALLVRHPLRRFTATPEPYASAAAHREARTLTVKRALLQDHRGLTTATLRENLGPADWKRWAVALGIHSPPPGVPDLPPTVTLRALRLFLEDPLQGWAHYALGLRADEDDDRLAVVDERFRTEARDTTVLLRAVVLEAVRDDRPLDEVYDAHADRLELRGQVPTGVFKQADRRRHLAILNGWQRALRKVFANRPRAFDPLRFGRGPAPQRARRVEPPVVIQIVEEAVEVRGTTLPCTDSPAASILLRARDQPAGGPPAHELGAFVDHVVRSAAGDESQPYVAWTVYGDGRLQRTRFDPFTADEARAYLGALIADLRGRAHDYALPFAAVHRAQDRGADAWEAELARVTPAPYGPLAGLVVAPPTPEDAQLILTRRFGAFYARRRAEDRS